MFSPKSKQSKTKNRKGNKNTPGISLYLGGVEFASLQYYSPKHSDSI